MAANRAPKQWCLTKSETINSFESWRQNLLYILTLDKNFAKFTAPGVTWLKQSKDNPERGFTDDGNNVDVAQRETATQKSATLELMLGQIANYCPVIARQQIVKKSTSLDAIWQCIRAHYGFQSTGAHFLDLCDIKLKPDERHEDLFQRLSAFFEDNLLRKDGGITHLGDAVTEDEDMSPSLENVIVCVWLSLIHQDLPRLVKQRYGTELRSRTIASIKPEISQALDSLLEELRTSDAKILRSTGTPTVFHRKTPNKQFSRPYGSSPRPQKVCPLCKSAKRPDAHFLSTCTFLPESDRRYITKARLIAQIMDEADPEDDNDYAEHTEAEPDPPPAAAAIRKVQVSPSPHINAFCGLSAFGY